MRMLVFGRNGQLARELRSVARERCIDAVSVGRELLNLEAADERTISLLIKDVSPSLVVNASAYTAVDRAEDERAVAFRLNQEAPSLMASACADLDVPFVHVSTDYVFDGLSGAPYSEGDPVRPRSVYGESKAAGEVGVAAAGGRSTTIRTSWVYSAHGSNFLRTMLRLAATRDTIAVVADQRGRPTWARDLAQAAIAAGIVMQSKPSKGSNLLHVAGEGDATWADFAEAIFAESNARGGPFARVQRITTAEYPTRAARPPDSRLVTDLARATLDWSPRSWRQALALCMNELFPQA